MRFAFRSVLRLCVVSTAMCLTAGMSFAGTGLAQMASAPKVASSTTGLLPAAEVEHLLPPSVFFSGQSAPLQLRNSAAFRTAAGRLIWTGLVDTSGYSTGVREKYQFYFVTEVPLTAGTLTIAPGVYGGGFLQDNSFVLLNVAGGELGRTATRDDKDLRRPRPLQMTEQGARLRLYLGRQYVELSPR